MEFIRRSLERAKTTEIPTACGDAVFAKAYPAVLEFMSCTRMEDGSDRKGSTITIMFDRGQFRAFLNDRHTGYSLSVVSTSFSGLLKALEASVTSDDPDWRQIGQGGQRKGQGGPKKKT